jgi:hypothetical protein
MMLPKQSRVIVSIYGPAKTLCTKLSLGVEIVGTVAYDLTNIYKSKIPYHVKDGVTQYEVSLVLNIRLDDDSGHLVFRILSDGKEVGKAGIDMSENNIVTLVESHT